jgi:hypothetical protein
MQVPPQACCFHPFTPQPIGRVNFATKWEEEHEDCLIDILREFLEKGTRTPYGKKIIHRIAQSLNNQLHDDTQYTNYQVGKKICRIRKTYALYAAFKRDNIRIGFGWNDDCGTINAIPE